MYPAENEERAGPGDTLGGRIVYAREQRGLTTAQLARRVGVTTETLHEWETDRAEPRSNRLLTLSGMLNVSPTWLLTGEGDSPVDGMNETEMMRIRAVVDRMRERVLKIADDLEQLRERLDSYQSYQE